MCVRDARHPKDGYEHARGGGDHVGEAVAELEGQHGQLARDAHQVGPLGHHGDGEGGLGGARRDNQVEKVLDHVHGGGGADASRIAHALRDGVQDGVDDLAVLQDDDDAAGEADNQRRHHDVFAAFQKESDHLVELEAVGDAHADAHGEEESGNLHHIPAVAQHADHQAGDGEQQKGQDEVVDGLADGEEAQQHEDAGDDGPQYD